MYTMPDIKLFFLANLPFMNVFGITSDIQIEKLKTFQNVI